MSDSPDNEPETQLPRLVPDDENPDGATIYKYRDFGNVQEDADVVDAPSPSPPPAASRGSVESSIRVQKFPVKLYAILAQKEFHDIITWMPHGRSWKVLKPNLFESLVMPLFFEYSNYHSFNRLVNAWSFRRISSGPDRGSYYHELFLRGKPHLQKYMRRLPKTHKKLPMKKEDEPNFYSMDKAHPLPTLEESPLPHSTIVPQIPRQGGLGGMGGMQQMHGMGAPGAGMPPAFFNQPGPKDSFEAREVPSMMGMGQPRGPMNMGMQGMQNMNSMNAGINNLRESGFPGQQGGGLGEFGYPGGGMDQFQRLRQFQQMQLLERQMGAGQMPGLGAPDPYAMMQQQQQQQQGTDHMGRRLNRQQC